MRDPIAAKAKKEARILRQIDVLQKAKEGHIKWCQAADILRMSPRQLLRVRERFLNLGIPGLRDGRTGKVQPRRISVETEEKVCRLKREVYHDFSVQHFHEKLTEEHEVEVSYTWTLTILQKHGLVTKAPARGKYRRHRERRPMRGMLLHLDASWHEWIPGLPKRDLVVMMDDADGQVLFARFFEQEGTYSTLVALEHVLVRYGRFCELYTDRGSHFCRTTTAGAPPDDEQYGQVSRVTDALGIRQILARSPQARGRSEREFETIQGRLPQELRVRGITDYERANRYLDEVFVADLNSRFMVQPAQPESAFTPLVGMDLRLLVSIQSPRKVGMDNTVRFHNRSLQLLPSEARMSFCRCPVIVHKFTDGTLGVSYQGRLLGRYSADGDLLDGRRQKRPQHRKVPPLARTGGDGPFGPASELTYTWETQEEVPPMPDHVTQRGEASPRTPLRPT
jgi:hypothetical protein